MKKENPTKASIIRNFIEKNTNLEPKKVVEGLEEMGIQANLNDVYSARHYIKKHKEKTILDNNVSFEKTKKNIFLLNRDSFIFANELLEETNRDVNLAIQAIEIICELNKGDK